MKGLLRNNICFNVVIIAFKKLKLKREQALGHKL
jgi:hypothetical protein